MYNSFRMIHFGFDKRLAVNSNKLTDKQSKRMANC